jgi:hypothetical protein
LGNRFSNNPIVHSLKFRSNSFSFNRIGKSIVNRQDNKQTRVNDPVLKLTSGQFSGASKISVSTAVLKQTKEIIDPLLILS